MIKWKQPIDWSTLPLTNTTTSFDKANDVFVIITDASYTDNQYVYNIVSIDHRYKQLSQPYWTTWHTKLKIHTYNNDHYINVNERRVYIDSILNDLTSQMKPTT